MGKNPVRPYFSYVLILTLLGSVLSTIAISPHAFADHDNIIIDIDDEYNPGESIEIRGQVDDVDDEVDEVTIIIAEPDGNEDEEDVELDDDEFSLDYEVGDDDGIYTVEVEYDSDSAFNYFLVDDEDDEVEVETDASLYEQGDTIEITGTVVDPQLSEDEVEITLMDPHSDFVIDEEAVEIAGDGDFDFEYDLEDDAEIGRYALKIVYDGDERGWLTLEVEEGSGSSSGGDITASITDATLAPGDEVEITGSIDDSDIEGGAEVILVVEGPDGDELDDYGDSVEPESDTGEFDFSFDLEEDADPGSYTVILSYEQLDDRELTFTVSTSSSGGGSSGGGGSGSGNDNGLTARLSKTSLLAGETLTISGVVPDIVSDEDGVSITVFKPDRGFIAAKFPEPESSEAYSASFVLPTSLEEDEGYTVIVNYDGNEVELSFEITGVVSGPSGGPITVETDRTTYSAGSTVRISGEISEEIFVPGLQVALQVFNPENAAYRIDPITPQDDGTYSYSMVVGGPLGVAGDWEVKVTYSGQSAETEFELTGGAPAQPRYNLIVEDRTFPIEYMTEDIVKSMFIRAADNKLVVSIDAEEDGTLTIILPREVIDAVQGGSDIQYIVATSDIDTGREDIIDITESSTNGDSRTLVIEYQGGTDLIEIQGTSVVPEFGPLTAIVIAIAIFGIIAWTAKFNKLSSFRMW